MRRRELPTFVSLKTHEKYRTACVQIGRYYLAENNYNQVFYWVFDYWRPKVVFIKVEGARIVHTGKVYLREWTFIVNGIF